MTTRVGRTLHNSAIAVPGVSTASGYVTGAVMGSAFMMSAACGVDGALVAQVVVLDRGTAGPSIRQHFYSTAFSAIPDGSAWTLPDVDFLHYLGWVPIGSDSYISAGTARIVSQVASTNIGIHAAANSRQVWSQLQFVSGNSAMGAIANPLWVNGVNLQD